MKAIVADDHPIVREVAIERLRSRFGPEASVVGVATYDALLLVLDMAPADLIVADLDMPDLGPGRTLTEVLRKAGDTPLIVFSSSNTPAVVRAIAVQGARGFVCKTETADRLIAAAEAVLQGETVFPRVGETDAVPTRAAALQAAAGERLVCLTDAAPPPKPSARLAASSANLQELTKRQREILRCVAQGLSNKQIARELGISDCTVKVHLHGLFERLGVRNRTQAAMLADSARTAAPRPDPRHPPLAVVR